MMIHLLSRFEYLRVTHVHDIRRTERYNLEARIVFAAKKLFVRLLSPRLILVWAINISVATSFFYIPCVSSLNSRAPPRASNLSTFLTHEWRLLLASLWNAPRFSSACIVDRTARIRTVATLAFRRLSISDVRDASIFLARDVTWPIVCHFTAKVFTNQHHSKYKNRNVGVCIWFNSILSSMPYLKTVCKNLFRYIRRT